VPAVTQVLHAVQAVATAAAERSAEIESARIVPRDLIATLADAGALRMYVPASLGGLELAPIDVLANIEALSHADASLGWTTAILNGSFFTAWLEPVAAKRLLDAPPGAGMAGALGPIGRARRAGDGFVLDGRWPFNSGSPHAGWFTEGAVVVDDGGVPITRPDGRPDWRLFCVPAAEVEVLDTWYVSGLRGTASNDVTISGAVVPDELTMNPILSLAQQDAPPYRWTCFALISSMFSGFSIGVARRAVEAFVALAATKTRRTTTTLATMQSVLLAVTRVEGDLRAARALVVDALGTAWDRALRGDPIDARNRVAIRLATAHAMETAVSVVDAVFAMSGGHALYDSSPIQRCWRDLHAASHHVFYGDEDIAHVGEALITGAEPHFMV
jgi:alkylation response protein AidB-like acyl-CoA dehydrogenase